MAGPKGEHGVCRVCGLELGQGTKNPCFYTQIRDKGFIYWKLLCRIHKEEVISMGKKKGCGGGGGN